MTPPRLPRPRISYANVIATLALFVALGGTSYAAVKIDGSDVKNGSLTGRDIKDRSIGSRDLKKRLQGRPGPSGAAGPRGTTGPRGIAGPRGTTGPEGPAGQREPSSGTFAQGPATTNIDGSTVTVASLDLEPGNWILSTSGLLLNRTESLTNVRCDLLTATDDASFDDLIGGTGNVSLDGLGATLRQDSESFSIDAGLKVTEPIQVHLTCSSGGPIQTQHTVITASRMTELTDQSERQAPD